MVNIQKLHNELRDAGIPVISVMADGTYILDGTATPDDYTSADAIVAAHDLVDYDALNAENARGELYAVIDAAIATLDLALSKWDVLSQTEYIAVLREVVRNQRKLLIYHKKELRTPIITD